MKQVLEIDDQPELAELLTATEEEDTIQIEMGRAVRFKKTHLDRFLQDNVHGKEVKDES